MQLDCKLDRLHLFLFSEIQVLTIFFYVMFSQNAQSDTNSTHTPMFAGCLEHFKSKEKVSTITSVGFKTLKEYSKKMCSF